MIYFVQGAKISPHEMIIYLRDSQEGQGLWELLHNPEFNCLEFEAIKKESGDNGFVMTPKRWIEVTGAVGIVSKQLLVLANMESYNAILIGQGKKMSDRIVLLRELAVKQMETLSQISTEGVGQLHG